MNTNYEVTSYVFRSIVNHLVDLEEKGREIIEELFSESSTLRDNYYCFLDDYIKKLEELLTSVQTVEKPGREKLNSLNYLPYVIIGSTVLLEDANDLSHHFIKIILPYDTSNSKDDLSCLSSLGKSLMLKKTGEIIETKHDDTDYIYKIKSIQYI